ncbi:uncharacterized protein LOC8274537 isoform X1 [Ricinus communis]|nr:uncharacterized protein LOC8274537 isoform X1 [Ricinus communis]|eukprot:XP_015572842.1 uncharacterized protein LOC8274537 isoform X1 [Ricinus communis]
MRPSSYPNGLKAGNSTELLQEKGMCPEGTIPIARTHLFRHPKTSPVLLNRTNAFSPPVHEYAQVSLESGYYYGAHAKLNVWNPAKANDGEFSLSQIWVLSGLDQDLNSIEAGWQVFPGDNKPRTFIYWTRDNYGQTGCYDLVCPGFVQTSSKLALGTPIRPVSIYDGNQYDRDIAVHKDRESGNWWLQIRGQDIGYWPSSIFTTLAESATRINWGGEIVNYGLNGRHTSTQMGSGHFPSEGYKKAAVLFKLGYIDDSGVLRDPDGLEPYITKSSCYDLQFGEMGYDDFGVHFYFGGPGYSTQCP